MLLEGHLLRLALLFCLPLIIHSLFSVRAASAQTVINYPSGFANAGSVIDPIGGAALTGSTIQLTNGGSQARNVWYQDAVNVEAFTTTFTFNFICPAFCGDGMGFMIISNTNPDSPSYWSGGSGGQFSWSSGCTTPSTGDTGCTAIHSIFVKFNLYDDETGLSGANLTGLYSGGESPQPPNPEYDMSGSGINMESGDVMRATLAYDGTVLTETVIDTVTNATYTRTYTVNIPSLVAGNTATVGFGGGTGAAYVTTDLDSWTYTVQAPGQASAPTFFPAAGTYTGSQNIAFSSTSTGAVVCYNITGSPATDGAAGCTSGTLYSTPITVPSSETLYAVAGGAGYSDSPVISASYVIQAAVATPTFSPAGGSYTAAQSVIISDLISNATIYYTVDGTTPTTSSIKYTGPITVSSTETLKAIAVATGAANSAVASAAYTINLIPVVSTPVFSPPGGVYATTQLVTLSDPTSGAIIYYTTDGSTPTTSSTKYVGPLEVSSTGTVRAVAAVAGDTNSAVATANYTISSVPVVAAPAFLPTPGVYASAQSVSLFEATSGATVYYTTDGSVPTISSTEYTGPITVSATETLQAIAVLAGDVNSAVAVGAYTISAVPVVATPTFSPPPGPYTATQPVTIFDTTSGATIYYTTNGTMPTTSSTAYSGPITVSSTETLEAIAAAPGDTPSGVASAAYTIGPALPSVATPTFSPAAGSYSSAQTVTVSDATSGATINYTTDGSIPTTLSTAYTGPITVSKTEVVQAIAAAAGDSNSAVASAAYTIVPVPPTVATPTFSPPAGAYTSAQVVTIADTTSGAIIYYTMDGSTPTTSSTRYSSPIMVSSTETLEAIAAAAGDSNSAVASAAYTITAAAMPSFTLSASPASLTADSSGQGTVTLTVTPQNGFDSAVSFACSGLPAGATCAFSPATVTPAGAAATTQLTITAPAQSSALPSRERPFLPLSTLALTVGLFGWGTQRRWRHWLLLAAAYAGIGVLFGCGGGSSSGGGTPTTNTPPPTPMTSTITVMATSGSLQTNTTIMLTVN